jgi:hypothetical protein
MKGLWWQSTQPGAQELQELDECREGIEASSASTQISVLTFLRQQIVTAFLIGGTVLVMYVLYQWSTMLLLAVIGAVTCIVTFRLLLDSKPAVQTAQAQEKPAEIPQVQEARDVKDAESETESPQFVFPDTPMPSLVRVLETIDLSSSGIEHFIKTSEVPVAQKEQGASRTKEYDMSE